MAGDLVQLMKSLFLWLWLVRLRSKEEYQGWSHQPALAADTVVLHSCSVPMLYPAAMCVVLNVLSRSSSSCHRWLTGSTVSCPIVCTGAV